MKHVIVATAWAALLAACGGGDGAAGAIDAGAGPRGDVPSEATPAPAGSAANDVALDLLALGPASPHVRAFRFAPAKVAFHFGDPAEPLFEGAAGQPTPCEASAATFVRDAPAEVHVAFGATDSRLRVAGVDLGRGALLVEAWILVERGSAQIERAGGQLRPVHLPVCEDARGEVWSVIRAVPSRPLLVTDGAETTATVDLSAGAFIVETASCLGTSAPAECSAAEDEGDDGDPGTRLVYLLHSLALRGGP